MRDNDEGERMDKANSDYDIVKKYINSLNEQGTKILYTRHSLRREIDGVSKNRENKEMWEEKE